MRAVLPAATAMCKNRYHARRQNRARRGIEGMIEKRGYFGLGVEGISKPMNAGSLMRSAHAFGARFLFAVAPDVNIRKLRSSDTSGAAAQLPYYEWESPAAMALPKGCQLVGIELTDQAVEMPSFRHPDRAAYVLGPERGALSPAMLGRCDHVVQIPIAFCINVGIAGAITLYDRMISRGRFAERPVRAGGPTDALPMHVHGPQRFRKKERAKKPAARG